MALVKSRSKKSNSKRTKRTKNANKRNKSSRSRSLTRKNKSRRGQCGGVNVNNDNSNMFVTPTHVSKEPNEPQRLASEPDKPFHYKPRVFATKYDEVLYNIGDELAYKVDSNDRVHNPDFKKIKALIKETYDAYIRSLEKMKDTSNSNNSDKIKEFKNIYLNDFIYKLLFEIQDILKHDSNKKDEKEDLLKYIHQLNKNLISPPPTL